MPSLLSVMVNRLDVELDTSLAYVHALECLAMESAEPGIADAAREIRRRYSELSQKIKFLRITVQAKEATTCETPS